MNRTEHRLGVGIPAAFLCILIGCHQKEPANLTQKVPDPQMAAGKPDTVFPFPGQVACADHGSFDAWSAKPDSGVPAAAVSVVALAGGTTLIPEYHDCQRLITKADSFGPLVGIWVSETINSSADTIASHPNRPVPFAIIHAWDGHYLPLQIHQGWNCLFLMTRSDKSYQAFMTRAESASDCVGLDSAEAALRIQTARPLSVSAISYPDVRRSDIPDVGRWDRQRHAPFNFIGMKCGAAWCEVYDKAWTSHSSSNQYRIDAPAGSARGRVWKVKGWYDEQALAEGTTPPLHPSQFLGIIVPDSSLGTFEAGDFDSSWVHVASVATTGNVPQYWDKLRIKQAVLPQGGRAPAMTEVFMCWENPESTGHCPGLPDSVRQKCSASPPPPKSEDRGWYTMIVPPGKESRVFKCTVRNSHVGHNVPGTARWKWMESDETQWARCGTACCTVRP